MSRTTRDLEKRIEALESLLPPLLPKCRCGKLATRLFDGVGFGVCSVCDDDACMADNFCVQCGQIRYDVEGPCRGYDETKDAECGCRQVEAKVFAANIREVPGAEVIRSLAARSKNRSSGVSGT